MATLQDIQKYTRDFERYTGDGLPNEPTNTPLPVGDPASGVYNPTKADIRELLTIVVQTLGDPDALDGIQELLSDVAAQTITLEGVGGTADAITANLPASAVNAGLTSIPVGSAFRFRAEASNNAENPTISVAGITHNIRSADGAALPAGGLKAGIWYDLIRYGSTTARLMSAEVDRGLLQSSIAAETALRRASEDRGDILRLNTSGTGDAIIGAVNADQDHLEVSAGRVVSFFMPTTNQASDPKIDIGGKATLPVRSSTGDVLPALALAGGARYLGTVAGSGATMTLRLVGTTTVEEIAGLSAVLEARIDAEDRGDAVRLNTSGTGDSITATVNADQSHLSMTAGRIVTFFAPSTNQSEEPVINIAGQSPKKITTFSGGPLPKGGIIGGGRYLGILSGSGATATVRIIGARVINDIVGLPEALAALGTEIDKSADASATSLALEISERKLAERYGDVISLTSVSGTGDAATAEKRKEQSHIEVVDGVVLHVVWPAENATSSPTLKIGVSAALPIRGFGGRQLSQGELKRGQNLLMVVSGGQLRMLGASSIGDIGGLSEAITALNEDVSALSGVSGFEIYPTVQEGLDGTEDGKSFGVGGQAGSFLTLYRKDGTQAVEVSSLENLTTLPGHEGQLLGFSADGGYQPVSPVIAAFRDRSDAEIDPYLDESDFAIAGGKIFRKDPEGGAFVGLNGVRWARDRDIPVADVMDFGGSARLNPDGSETDNTALIDANNWLLERGGGLLYFPPGNFLIGAEAEQHLLSCEGQSKIHILGSGPGATKVTLASGSNCSMLYMRDMTQSSVRSLSLDWNKLGQTQGGHCLRIDAKTFWASDLELIGGVYNLAIGQSSYVEQLFLSDITMRESVSDALDAKNRQNRNRGLFAKNIFVESFGVDPTGLQDENEDKAGIDLRGKWKMVNVHVEGVKGNDQGIRMRPGESDQNNGEGAHGSQIDNWSVVSEAIDGTETVAVNIAARDVAFGRGSVQGSRRAVVVNAERATIQSVNVEGATEYAFHTIEGTNAGAYAYLEGCVGRDCGINAFRIEADNNTLIAPRGFDCGNGAAISIRPSAFGTDVIFPKGSGNQGGLLEDLGEATSVFGAGRHGRFTSADIPDDGPGSTIEQLRSELNALKAVLRK